MRDIIKPTSENSRAIWPANLESCGEEGRLTRPVFGATLIGNGPDILTKVTRIGYDLALDEGVGLCSKAGQTVPVGVGLPTILVSEITVGGTRQ